MTYPEILNKSPKENETGIDGLTLISFDVYDSDSDINPNTFEVYVDGSLAFSGPNTFHSPFDGPLSSITQKEIEGTDGYNIIINYTGEFTSNTLYSVRAYVEDFSHLSIDDTWVFRTGNKIISVGPSIYEVVLDVNFEQPISISPSLLEPANYKFTNGMYARKVEVISNKIVRLWVELFYAHDSFSLSLSPTIVDGYGDSIPTSYNSISFSPFDSSADLSNIKGRIKTWRNSYVVTADENSIYLGGSKGIDVFNKRFGRWAQIFNENRKTESIFVANFGGTHNFSDKKPPYLFNIFPSPDSFAQYDSSIIFSIGDENLAVESTALKIYIQGVLAFNGEYGGWQDGFLGSINVNYQYLDVIIKSIEPYPIKTKVSIRIVAKDLLKNVLDTTYSYTVAEPVSFIGWGLSYWGKTKFGVGVE